MFGVIGGDKTLPRSFVGHFVAGRNDVFAAVAEHDQRRFLIAAFRRGDECVDGVLRCFVVLLREAHGPLSEVEISRTRAKHRRCQHVSVAKRNLIHDILDRISVFCWPLLPRVACQY